MPKFRTGEIRKATDEDLKKVSANVTTAFFENGEVIKKVSEDTYVKPWEDEESGKDGLIYGVYIDTDKRKSTFVSWASFVGRSASKTVNADTDRQKTYSVKVDGIVPEGTKDVVGTLNLVRTAVKDKKKIVYKVDEVLIPTSSIYSNDFRFRAGAFCLG